MSTTQIPVPEVPIAAKVVFPSGATVSHLAPRYELVPPEAIARMTHRLECGADVHGEDNLAKGLYDHAFLDERRRHLFQHALLYLHGDNSDDHLAAVLANAAILIESERIADNAAPSPGDADAHLAFALANTLVPDESMPASDGAPVE